MDPLGEGLTECRVHLRHPFNLHDDVVCLAGFVLLGPGAVALCAPPGDSYNSRHRVRTLDGIADRQVRSHEWPTPIH
jgi:hypothetical protein